jgi:hypothetical protein
LLIPKVKGIIFDFIKILKMETITVKIEGQENVSFFVKLLEKFNFVKEVSVNKKKNKQFKGVENPPIEWAVQKPSINDFSGIWNDNPVTLEEIRAKAWKRN